MKAALQYIFLMVVLAAVLFFGGCASCQSCRAQSASSQAPPPPPTPTPTPRTGFATPPTDDEQPEAGNEEPPVKKPSRIRTPKTRDAEGESVVIEQSGSGVIYLNSPGVGSPPASQMQMQAVPTSYVQVATPSAYPLIPGPLPDAQAIGLAKRVGGSLWYLFTGKCPTKTQAVGVGVSTGFATAPVAAMMLPTSTTAMVPVQQAAYVPIQVQAQPMQAVYQAPPQVSPTVVYMTAPNPAATTPVAIASPQTPKKSLFHFGR